MNIYTSKESDPLSTGSFEITKSPVGAFTTDEVRMTKRGEHIGLNGYKVLDTGERAGISLTFIYEEGTFKEKFGSDDIPPWGSYLIGNWSHTADRGETTHTYLDKPEHADGRFYFITKFGGKEHECEGKFDVQKFIIFP
jgi:hypothetical protein